MVLGPLLFLLSLIGFEEFLHVGMAEQGVVVKRHLCVDGLERAVLQHHEGIDFHQRRIFLGKEPVERLEYLCSLLHLSLVVEELIGSLIGLEVGHTHHGVDDDLLYLLG